VRIWQCGIRGEVAKSAATAVFIATSTRATQSAELIQVLLKKQRTLPSPRNAEDGGPYGFNFILITVFSLSAFIVALTAAPNKLPMCFY
jgi:hypothetical protein